MQKHVKFVDLVKSFLTSSFCLPAKFGFDTAENEPLKVLYLKFLESKHIVFWYFGGIFNFHFEFFRNLHPGHPGRGGGARRPGPRLRHPGHERDLPHPVLLRPRGVQQRPAGVRAAH